ncbi:MAG: putative Polysaccharide biosynthesis protein [Myxococcales bacterium]|nr:putative Polysaccharide biosynthesis protein [Myxococcales bacterium]
MTAIGKARALAMRVLGASSPLVAGRLISAALTFALPLILARLLLPEEFGTYKQFFLIAQTLQLTGQLGLTQSLYYFLPRGGKERGAYVSQTFFSLAVLGVGFGIALWFAAPQLGRWLGDGSLASLRAPLALFGGLMLASASLESAILSEGRIVRAALAYVLTDGLRAGALVLGAKYGGPAGLFWAAAGTAAARVAALFFIVATRTVPFARPNAALFRTQLAYALPFAGASYLYVAQRYFSQYAVSASFDTATFALFAVASFHMPVVDIVFTPLSDVMIVHIGKAQHAGDKHAAWRAWDDAVQKLASILFPAAVCAWLFGPTLLPLLFTHKYDGSVPLFLLATAEIPLWILPLDALLRAAGDTRFLFAFNGVRIALTGGLVIGGIHWFGLPGAIAGGILSEGLARVGMLARGKRFLGVSAARMCDWAALARTAMAAAVACLPAYGVRFIGLHGMAAVVVGALVYGAVYLGITFAMMRLFRGSPAQPIADSQPRLVVGR